jgi:uncharacterized protein (DUF1330 family)
MIHYMVLVKIKDTALFARYLAGHLPTIEQFGGKISFRSIENRTVLGPEKWDVIAIQEWPTAADFDRWWNSEEYRPWAELRDHAADMTIVACRNSLS